jgi:NADH-quinone oxidoreductase subunit C
VTKTDGKAIHGKLVAAFGERIVASHEGIDPFTVVAPDAILEVGRFAKSEADLAFDNLMCLSAVDYPKENPPRIEVVYHLLSYAHGHTYVLKVHLPRDNPRVSSVEPIWGVANWHEREAYDLFGIIFEGHTDMRRILLPDDWQGYPLRKDWADPDFYNGMHVKPTQQMAERALAGEKIGVGPFDFTPPNRHVED